MPMALNVVIAGGGTGGHLYPGIAVARELLRRVPEATVTFAGTARGLRAGSDPQRRAERQVDRLTRPRHGAAGAGLRRCLGHPVAAASARRRRRRRLQL